MNVMGLDPSLTATGIVWGGPEPFEMVLSSKLRGAARLSDLRYGLAALAQKGTGTDLVVIEGPSYASSKGQAHSMGGLWWTYRVALHELGIPVLEVTPTQLKMFATGKGNASKDRVVSEVSKRAGRVFDSNDLVDAYVLWSIGRHLTARPYPMCPLPASHLRATEKLELPLVIGPNR